MPREFVPGGVLDINGGTQRATWGAALTSVTPVTAAFLLKLRTAGSANFDILWGYTAERWFFPISGLNTRRIAFNVKATTEKSSGYITSDLVLGTWYMVIGGYDPSGGASNHFIEVYNVDGTAYASAVATNTGALTSTIQELAAGYDSIRSFSVNAQMAHFRVWNRIITSGERTAVAQNNPVNWSREGLQLETYCNEPTGTLRNTATNSNTTQASLSGGAITKPEIPSQFARSRTLIT